MYELTHAKVDHASIDAKLDETSTAAIGQLSSLSVRRTVRQYVEKFQYTTIRVVKK